jgi:hypothetical protein
MPNVRPALQQEALGAARHMEDHCGRAETLTALLGV